MEPKIWYQVSYSRDGAKWYTVNDDRGRPRRYYSQEAAEQEEVNQKKRRFYPAKQTLVCKIIESHFSSLEDKKEYVTWEYAVLV